MEWTKLELRKAAVLRKEVDVVIRQVSAAVESDNQNQVEDLMEAIQFRIDQIEEFYAQNDCDDRAILFEKQRLRLRRTLQNLAPPPSPEKLSPQHTMPTQNKDHSKDTHTRQQNYALRSSSLSPSNVGFSSCSSPLPSAARQQQKDQREPMHINELTGHSPRHSRLQDQRDAAADSGQDDGSALSSLHSHRSKRGGKKSTLPTYAWETSNNKESSNSRDSPPRRAQERIFTASHGSFLPSSTPGVYMAEEEDSSSIGSSDSAHAGGGNLPPAGDSSESGYPSTHLDVQIVLTPAEFEAYVLRKRNVTKKTNDSKNAILCAKTSSKTSKDSSKYSSYLSKNSSFLSTQTPYMDPKRVKWDLCRPKQADKWMHPKGFL